MKNIRQVRNYLYKRNIKIFKNQWNYNFTFLASPYDKIKSIFNLEIASILMFLFLKTKTQPNTITFIGVFWSSLGVFFIFLNYNLTIYIGLFIFFTRIIPDYIDGAIASYNETSSVIGHELDLWAALVLKLTFISAVSFYLFNKYDQLIFIYCFFLIVLTNCLDFRYHSKSFNSKVFFSKKLNAHFTKEKKEIKKNFLFTFLKFFHYTGRSKYTDLIIFLIIIEMNFLNINIVWIFPFLWSFLCILVLIRSFFVVINEK
tara:strand:+ start:2060 stop:2836 length:777 start_codon:yes stop_codon:yes gene_type:complete